LWEHNGVQKESTEDFKHLQELEKVVRTGTPSNFDDPAFAESFQLGSAANQSAYVSTGAVERNPWWKEITTEPLKGYNPDKAHDTSPGYDTPAPISTSIKLYNRKDAKAGYFLSRQGHLKPKAKGAARPHLYQEDGHHYMSHHPEHKELWRRAAEESENEQDGDEDDDNVGDEEEEGGEEEEAEETGDEETIQTEEDPEESEPELPEKVTKKSKTKSGGGSELPTRPKATPKKLYRFGQEKGKAEEGQKEAHKSSKKASGGGEPKPTTKPKATPKRLKKIEKENEEEED